MIPVLTFKQISVNTAQVAYRITTDCVVIGVTLLKKPQTLALSLYLPLLDESLCQCIARFPCQPIVGAG